MSDIDLIPADYRRRLARLAQLRAHAWAALLLLLASAVAYGGLDYARGDLRERVARLQQDKSITEAQRADLERLHAEQARLGEQVRVQTGLAGGVSAQDTFLVVDRALREQEVWFERWGFERSGQAQEPPAEATAAGYILILPREGEARAEAWRIDTHMTIEGQARDHQALSGFVSRLLQQPEVASAHLLNSTLLRQGTPGVVRFKLLVGIDMGSGT